MWLSMTKAAQDMPLFSFSKLLFFSLGIEIEIQVHKKIQSCVFQNLKLNNILAYPYCYWVVLN